MFVAKELVFTELHKTAGSHIGMLLANTLGGEQIGKHNRIPVELRSKFVLGSIRNPWDWYVSLWGYGCDGKGSVFFNTTRKNNALDSSNALVREMFGSSLTPMLICRQWRHEQTKPTEIWQSVYKDVDDVEGFRRWIRLMFSEERRFDIGEGFGNSPLSSRHGLLSYRFFKLFTGIDRQIYAKNFNTTMDGLTRVWENYGFINAFVKQESLEEDFINALMLAGVTLSDTQQTEIRKARENKTNTSSRKPSKEYYDEETANLIFDRERFIIDKFSYDISDIF
ncbi:hypothetical protein [Alteromonas sp. S167]|uniref:hypothetical protein n=1 Tax=Alteromonas sp. S167 TaxID=3117402 RepID=UPI002FE24E35